VEGPGHGPLTDFNRDAWGGSSKCARERALIYKTLLLTGLRKGGLASLTVGQLDLEHDPPFLTLDAADEKNRQGNSLPLRADLAAELQKWLRDKAAAQEVQGRAIALPMDSQPLPTGKRSRSFPAKRQARIFQRVTTLPADMPVFDVPAGVLRILNRDVQFAGIPKTDDRGRTIDVHALRHTFGTHLSKAGVAPRVAQAAMRHSTIDLTMNVYTDPRLLDVHGALDALPAMSLHGTPAAEIAAATGTDDHQSPQPTNRHRQHAPTLAPTLVKPCHLESLPDQDAASETLLQEREKPALHQGKRGLFSGSHQVEVKGIEPSTSALRNRSGEPRVFGCFPWNSRILRHQAAFAIILTQ